MTKTPHVLRSTLYAALITLAASRFTFHVSRITLHAPRFTLYALRRPLPLVIILFAFTLLTFYNSILLPLGEAADETDHYQYLRFVARTGHPPLTEAERNEAGFKGGLAPLYYWLTAWPIALVGEATPPEIRRIDARPERHIPTDGLGINHMLHTLDELWPLGLSLGTKPWRGQPLAMHLVRLLSLPMGWVTIIATYALARRLLPNRPIVATGAAAFVAFLPRFVISSAVINDDNLVFALTALLLLIQVIILQGNYRPLTFAIFGALFGLALITKYFSLILIPEILFTLVVYYRGARGKSQVAGSRLQVAGSKVAGGRWQVALRSPLHAPRFSLHAPVIAFIVALALTAGPWFIFVTVRFNRVAELGLIAGLAASLGEPQITEGLVGLLSGQAVRPPAATYSLTEWFSLLYRSFWFEYGWMQIFAPGWVYSLYTVLLLVALGGFVGYLLTNKRRATEHASRFTFYGSPLAGLLGFHLILFVIVVLARYLLSATIDTGQGRHLYPALPVIALLMSLGLYYLRFWIYDLRLKEPTDPKSPLLRAKRSYFPRSIPGAAFLLLTPYFLLLTTAFLIPAFILPHYQTLPITVMPPAALPITFRQEISWANGLTLAGYDVGEIATAGQLLPVTLYWRANQEAEQDYLISLCLQDEQSRPVACWRGHFVDGRYPARAWETGDTIIDTIFIPIPPCEHIDDTAYRLHLELWPLALDSPRPTPGDSPVLAHTFTDPLIAIQPGDSAQNINFWRGSDRLSGSANLELNQTVTQLSPASGGAANPIFENPETKTPWLPVSGFDSKLYLPCADTPAPQLQQHSFIADPTLLPGRYQPDPPNPSLSLNFSSRLRALAPAQSSLTFADTLATLSLQLPDQNPVDLNQPSLSLLPTPYSLLPTDSLHLTIHWQARRWMADPLIVSLKLLDRDFMVAGERIATLGDRYPNVLWIPGEIVEETYPLRLKPNAPPGLYRLELSLIRQDQRLPDGFEYLPLSNGETNLYPLTVRVLDPAHDSPPSHPVLAQLGQAIDLIGYDLNPNSKFQIPNSKFELALYWQSSAKIPTDYTVFTQLIGPDGQVWAQWDNPPQAGRYPTTAWAENDRVVDRYTLTLREGAPPGEYRLLVGMYDPSTGQRLAVTIDQKPQPDQSIELARLTLSP